MKPWDEMTEEERVEWNRQHGATMTPEEAVGLAEGLLQNPEMLAEVERVLAAHRAKTGLPANSTPTDKSSIPNAPPGAAERR